MIVNQVLKTMSRLKTANKVRRKQHSPTTTIVVRGEGKAGEVEWEDGMAQVGEKDVVVVVREDVKLNPNFSSVQAVSGSKFLTVN